MIRDIIQKINSSIIDYRSTVENESNNDMSDTKQVNKDLYEYSHDNEMDRIYSNFGLHEKVVAFFDGRDWNVISLNFMLRHPILLYKHWSDKEQVYFDNSLLVCPLTMRAMIYKGKIKIENIVDDYELVIRNEDTNDVFPISNPYTGHLDAAGVEKRIKSHVKRVEVKILEHRDMFAFDSDPRYITIELDNESEPIVEPNYLESRFGIKNEELLTIFHPKSLVYVVQYYSETDGAYRHLVLISANMSKDEIVGYRYKNERFWSYSEQNKEKLIEKRAFIYPMLWFTIEKVHLANYDVLVISD